MATVAPVSAMLAVDTDGQSLVTDGASVASAHSLGDTGRLPQQTADGTNNSTDVIHENPDEVDSEDDLDRLASYLTGALNGQIESSTLRLSRGEYEAAKSALGDEYDTPLRKYVDVEGETAGDGATEEYETVKETQRDYIDTVSEFQETRREYEAAKQAGDTERARELARRLSRLDEAGETQSERLIAAFDGISNETGDDLSETSTRLAAVQSNISAQRRDIVGREFVATRLDVTSYDRNISFTDPLVLTGSLVTDNGTPVETTNATFAVGDQRIRTAVGADGGFELAYRPTRVAANASELTVRYLPSNASAYQRSERAIPVSITQVAATTTLADAPTGASGYADPVSVRATVSVNETPVTDYRLSAVLGGVPVSTARTDGRGHSTLSGTVPATAPVGDATLRVGPARDGRAVRVEPASVSVPITSEATTLDVRAGASANRTVVVAGALETREGEAVEDQPVAISVAGHPVETVSTNSSGAYRTTVSLPANVTAANATVSAAFDGTGTNLESASATTTVRRPGNGGGSARGGLPFGLTDLLWVVSGTAVVGLVAVVLLRRDGETAASDGGTAESVAPSVDGGTSPAPTPAVPTMLDSASDSLSSGCPNDAVVVAYAGARRALAADAGIDDAATHWEFYEQCVDAGVGSADSLESLTAGYELAAYSGVSVSDDEAERLVETARALVDATESNTSTN
ncbi:hypothetical protein C440_04328 [Haloferax mucosum ATCC BAA-1512]|uniref:DUF4129 domain-containing protein n=1 Tax=Haloferax mucosum ATCC BAA-1512 TaxID=662479 RepID=M0IM98_9EURY|nr:hypothetical protein C440_04328 [Haloferax mucosum ATCC BAA-1512]